jgi:sortase A
MRWSRWLLLAFAVGALGYCAFVVADTWLFQKEASLQFAEAHIQTPATHGLMGRMEIPRLGVSVMIAEGTANATLRRAAGHIEGTGLPGRAGNIGLAGHRDTLFRPLRNIRPDDVILLTTLDGNYRYRVVSTRIVSPADVSVLDADASEVLTLVTCYPFYLVGPAPDRFIVRAIKMSAAAPAS